MAGLSKYSVMIAGHSTSLSLEPEFWTELQDIARRESKSINGLIAKIDEDRQGNLSQAVRLYILKDLKRRLLHSDEQDK